MNPYFPIDRPRLTDGYREPWKSGQNDVHCLRDMPARVWGDSERPLTVRLLANTLGIGFAHRAAIASLGIAPNTDSIESGLNENLGPTS